MKPEAINDQDTKNTGNVGGILLYAKTDEDIIPNGTAIIGGNSLHRPEQPERTDPLQRIAEGLRK